MVTKPLPYPKQGEKLSIKKNNKSFEVSYFQKRAKTNPLGSWFFLQVLHCHWERRHEGSQMAPVSFSGALFLSKPHEVPSLCH